MSPRPRSGIRLALAGAALLAGLLVRPVLAQVSDPPVVIDAFERARDSQNLDAALAQFADDAVVTVEGRPSVSFAGKEQIRRFLVVLGAEAPRVTSSRHVVGSTITWTERDTAHRFAAPDLWVEAVVRDGKIRSIAYRPGLSSASAQTGSPVRVPPALLGVAGAASIGLLAIGVPMLLGGGRRRPAAPSRLRGHLLAELDQWQLARRT